MKNQRMSVKRRPVKKRGPQTLFANVVRKKRHRAATATPADFEGDVPNLGIARALVVILLIHVVAIGGIFFHSHWLSNDESSSKAAAPAIAKPLLPASPAAAIRRDNGENLPTIRSGDSLYTVGTGDTYQSISQRFGIDEMELRRANENIQIRQGRVLRIPPKMITAVEPPQVAELRVRAPEVTAINPPAAPVETVPLAPVRVTPAAPQLVDTDAARQADARANGTTVTPSESSSGETYKVKSGDTFWRIAQRYGTTVDKLMKVNGIDNARHLRIGANLVIPD